MIYGERIRLRAPEREDLPRFVAWLNDPDVRKTLALSLPFSLALARAFSTSAFQSKYFNPNMRSAIVFRTILGTLEPF